MITLSFISKIYLNILRLSLTVVVMFSLTEPAKSQSGFKKELRNLKLLEEKQTEKVHLHLDRNIFSPGEDVWFKAYLLEGTFHDLSVTSHNLHVDIISPKGIVTDSKTIVLHNGVGYGDFHLNKEKYYDGKFQIRAYTNHMRNFGSDLFFTKEILISETITTSKKEDIKQESKITLTFFPEGGNLVQNVANKVAFKANDNYGHGVDIQFSLFDENNNLLQKVSSTHKGMGHFQLIPNPGEKYYALIDSENFTGIKRYLPLPIDGHSILIGDQFHNFLNFEINTSPALIKGQELKYIIQSRGVLAASGNVKINAPTKSLRIDKAGLAEGISCLTLYNENDVPIAERLFYNQLFKKINIEISTDKESYAPREKVQLNIVTKNDNGNPVQSNLSLAVIDQFITNVEKMEGLESDGIIQSILLDADLKSSVEEAGFYFQDFDIKKHYLLDLVLLTHGWRKYVWKEIIEKDKLSLEFDYEKGFSFSGTASTLIFNKPVADSRVTISMIDEGVFFEDSKTDSIGRFKFENIYLMDTTVVIFQAYNKNDKKKTVVKLDETAYQLPEPDFRSHENWTSQSPELNDFITQTEELQKIKDAVKAKRHIFIDEVTIEAKNKKKDGHFRIYKEADHVLKVDDVMESYPDIFSMIRGRVPGAQIQGACPEIQVVLRGFSSLTGNNSAGFILDGMFVDAEAMCSVVPYDVDKIEILNSTTAGAFGSRGANGIIAVYRKKGTEKKAWVPIGIHRAKQKGYYRAREFYVPNYDKPDESYTVKDIRNTLFWEPYLTTNEEGKAQVSFFNGDKESNYNIRVEGVGLAGGLGQTNSSFKVEKN